MLGQDSMSRRYVYHGPEALVEGLYTDFIIPSRGG